MDFDNWKTTLIKLGGKALGRPPIADISVGENIEDLLRDACLYMSQYKFNWEFASEEELQFYAYVVVLTSHFMGKYYEHCQRFLAVYLEACKVLVQFIHHWLKNPESTTIITEVTAVNILSGLCEAKACLEKEEVFLFMYKFGEVSVSKDISKKDKQNIQNPLWQVFSKLGLEKRDWKRNDQRDDWYLSDGPPQKIDIKAYTKECITTLLTRHNIGEMFLRQMDGNDTFTALSKKAEYFTRGVDVSSFVMSKKEFCSAVTQLKLINTFLKLPLFASFEETQLELLANVVVKCLYLAIGVIEFYKGNTVLIEGDSTEKKKVAKESSTEDVYKGEPEKAVESSMEILEKALCIVSNMTVSSRDKLNNLRMLSSAVLLNGLCAVLQGSDDKLDGRKLKKFEAQLKWYEGFMVSLQSITTKLASLITAIFNDLKFNSPEELNGKRSEVVNEVKITESYTWADYMDFLFKGVKFLSGLWEVFIGLYDRIKALSEAQFQFTVVKTGDASKGGEEQSRSLSNGHSGDDSSGDEGSLLGHWFEKTLADGEPGQQDRDIDRLTEESSKIQESCNRAMEMMTLLAGVILDLVVKSYSTSLDAGMLQLVNDSINKNFLKSVGSILLESNKPHMDGLHSCFQRLLNILLKEGIMSDKKLETFLEVLGFSLPATNQLDLPVNNLKCFVIATVILKKQGDLISQGKSGDSERASCLWKMVFEYLERSIIVKTDHSISDLNKDFLQILLLFWHNFSAEQKLYQLKECIKIIQRIPSITDMKSYLTILRLLIIFDYMLRFFVKPSTELVSEVAERLITPQGHSRGCNKESEAVQFECLAQERFNSEMSSSSDKKHFNVDQSPSFYNLRSPLSDASIESEVIGILQTANNDGFVYNDFYCSLLDLMVKMIKDLNKEYSNKIDVVTNSVAIEAGFGLLWELLNDLPPPPEVLLKVTSPQKIGEDPTGFILFLKLGTKFLEKSKNPISITMNTMDIFDGSHVTLKEKKVIAEKLYSSCHKATYFMDLSAVIVDNIINIDQQTLPQLLLYDAALVFVLNCMKEFKVLESSTELIGDHDLTPLLGKLIDALVRCSTVAKNIIFTWTKNEEDSCEIDHDIYSLVIDAGAVPHAKKSNIWAVAPELPKMLREAIENWQSIQVKKFVVSGDTQDDFMASQRLLINSVVQRQLAADMYDGHKFDTVGILKHAVHTLLCVVEFLCIAGKTEISESCKKGLIETLVGFSTNPIMEPYQELVNDIMELLVQPLKEEKVQEILQYHILTVCNGILKVDRESSSSKTHTKAVLLECLKFMKTVMNKSSGHQYLLDFFADKTDDFRDIITSAGNKKCSSAFFTEILHIAVKVLDDESTGRNNVTNVLVEFFVQGSEAVTEWLVKALMLPCDESDTNRLDDSLKVLLESIIKYQSGVSALLNCCLDACSKIVDRMFIEEDFVGSSLALAQFLEVLPRVALHCEDDSHIFMIKKFLLWAKVIGEWFAKSKNESENDSRVFSAKESCFVLLDYLHKILFSLKSVQSDQGYEKDNVDHADNTAVYHNETFTVDDVDEEESLGEESDDDSTCNMLCTFTVTQKEFKNQHWYHCHTCKMNDGVGCCTVCAKICHKDHDVTYAKFGSFFCDCGAKEDGSCKALTKRSPSEKSSHTVGPFSSLTRSSAKLEKTVVVEADVRSLVESHKVEHVQVALSKGTADVSSKHKEDHLTQFVLHNKDDILRCLAAGGVMPSLVSLLEKLTAYHFLSQKDQVCSFGSSQKLKEALEMLHIKEKTIQSSETLMMTPTSIGGISENVRLNVGEEQGQQIRQLLSAHVIHHSCLELMQLQKECSWNLLVCHGKGKITTMQISGLDKQETASGKVTVSQVSTAVVPFTVLSISNNQINESTVAVCGLKDCHVLTFSSSKAVDSHLALSLRLETGNFVIRALWLPGSETMIAVLTADFVKIFDLSISLTTPQYHFLIASGHCRDMTFACRDGRVTILLISSHGHICTEVLDSTTSAAAGPFYLTNIMTVTHPAIVFDPGQTWDAGASIYYSHALEVLLFSYSNGKNFVGVPIKDMSETSHVFQIKTEFSSASALCLWKEVNGHPGLFQCRSQTSGNPVLVMITPESVLVQEIKSGGRTKLQDTVCFRYSKSNAPNVADFDTAMVHLFEDGTLQIGYVEDKSSKFWIDRQSFYLKTKMQDNTVKIPKSACKDQPHTLQWGGSTFPTDFFEHCQQSDYVEFGGKDLLHVYNSQQIKQRLNTAGMYVANTKPFGFQVEVTNPNQSIVMVGIRVHVGIRSLESAPKYIEIFGRTIQFHMERNRWFDIPFTRNEALTADKKIIISFGPSSDPSGVSIVDSIKVYTKTKEAFGWSDEKSTQRKQEPIGSPKSFANKDKFRYRSISNLDSLLSQAVEATRESLNQFSGGDDNCERQSVLKIASYLLTQQFCPLLGQKGGQLLASIYPSKDEVNNKQDELQLKHAIDVLQSSWETIKIGSDSLDVDAVLYFLNVCKTVGRSRPKNLVNFVEEFWNKGFVLQDILDALLAFYSSQPARASLAPIYVQGCENLLNVIETATEVLFTWILGKPKAASRITDAIIKLLLNEDAAVCFAAKRGLSQGLQFHGALLKSRPIASPVPVDTTQDDRDKAQPNESPSENQEVDIGFPRPDNIAGMDFEQVEVIDIPEEITEQQNGLEEYEDMQAILQNPDDDAVLEMAIALSLQDTEARGEGEVQDRWLPSPQSFSRDSSCQSMSQLEINTAAPSKGNDTDRENTDEESPIVLPHEEKDEDFSSDSLLHSIISSMLTEFITHIPDLKLLSGLRSIPYLQILLLLCSNVKENEENKENIKKVVTTCAKLLHFQEDETLTFPERSPTNEVLLILMRFLSVLMSRHSSNAIKEQEKAGKSQRDEEKVGSKTSFCLQVGNLLVEHGTTDLCWGLLKILLKYLKDHKGDDQKASASSEGGSSLLKVTPRHNLLDTSPFFLKQYVKSHASDLFQDFPQLVTEMLLRLPYQIWKFFIEFKSQNFDEKWINLLCEYLMVAHAPLIRRQVRKLLLAICGSKEQYRYVKDAYSFASYIAAVRNILQDVLPLSRVIISYERAVSVTDHLRMSLDIALNRIENWQAFCQQDNEVLKFLLEISYMFSEEIASVAIQLLVQAFTKKKDNLIESPKSKKGQNKDVSSQLIMSFFNQCYPENLGNFAKLLLMESDSKSLRWKARDLLLTLYRNVPAEKQLQLVQLMWNLYEQMPELGQRAEQFVDLMGYFTVKTNGLEAEVDRFAVSVVQHIRAASEKLMHHPNAVLYEELQEFVDLDGYYVENTPCFTCNFPEVMFANLKLSGVKSDLRYLTTAQLVKLNATYNISKLVLRITDVKRTRMVKVMNVYYNNKAVQSVIELKNKREMWQLAKKVTLTPAQSDVKVEFSLPIVACNIMIEYSDFYDNLQLSAETLQCPRCSASVLANPGVCSNCGENVYQCHKCRAINYDERDPFLCTSCGFCKYGKFEYSIVAKPCCSVEPIADEEERQKALDSINALLDQADKIYNQLSALRGTISALVSQVEAYSGEIAQSNNYSKAAQGGNSVTPSTGNNVKKNIQSIASRYGTDCKAAFDEFSKLLQRITALRLELASYDENVENNRTAEIPSNPYIARFPISQKQFIAGAGQSLDVALHNKNLPGGFCYGCNLSTIEHSLTVLKALALIPSTRQVMLQQGAMPVILQCSSQIKENVRDLSYKLMLILMKDNKEATCQFTKLLEESIDERLEDQLDDYRMNLKLQNKLSILQKSLGMYDSCWEDRLRCVFKLFLKVVRFPSPRMFSVISLPCIKMILDVVRFAGVENTPVPVPASSESKGRLETMKWISENPHHTFEIWDKAKACAPVQSDEYLAEKYGHLWLQKLEDKKRDKGTCLEIDTWLSSLLFTPFSDELRQTVCGVVENICQSQGKRLQVIQILTRYLDCVQKAEDHAAEFLSLYKDLIRKSEWKWHLATLGILEKIASLLAEHVEYLDQREHSVTLFGLSQGFAVYSFAELLHLFFGDDKVRQEYSHKLISQVLQNYLTLRRLVLQRTKLVDEAQEILLGLIEQLTSGREEEEEEFITVCVNVLKQCSLKDIRTPVFLFERICSIIHKEEKEDKEFLIVIEKDSQQEDYLQGRMQGNPYNCKETGLGPLMRDIKNKICTECELVALLEDDTGMELLVNNKIINLDLPVIDVYKKIWCHKGERSDPMKIIYRMRGLLGDATEDIVENLDNDREKDVDEEYDYRRASVMEANGGMDLLIMRLSAISNFSREQKLLGIILKLLEYCVKVKSNRCYLSQPSVRALEVMLGTVNMALRQERNQGSNGGGAAIAERLLKLMEKILYEASTLEEHSSHIFTPLPVLPDNESQLDVLLGHITSPYVRSNPSLLEAVMKLIPFFSFGSEQSMNSLINHFLPYLDFERLDTEHSVDEKLYLECFCVIAGGISQSAHGSELKKLINSRDITSRAIEYLKKNIPSKSYRASGILDTAKWKEFLGCPALPYVLRLLTGLATGHTETQEIIGKNENILIIHMLEQVSSDEMVGSLAENLLEALSEHEDVHNRIKAARKETREEKRRMAMRMRQKQLDALGLTVNDSGQIKAKLSPLVKEINEVSDEKGLVCCICREGYEFQPNKILGIYTYTSRCILDEFENKPKKTQGYSTVSHFNVVHLDCHSEAVRHACSRDEWESATLQNGSAKCNGILPIWGPKVSESAFAIALARYNSYIQDSTGFREPTLYSIIHDIRLALLLFSEEKSFSDRIGGGGKNSNMYQIPYMAHLALYILNTSHQRLSEENVLFAFADANEGKWVESSYELEGPLFMAVFSWFILTLPAWKARKINIFKRLLLLFHVRSVSTGFTNSLKDCTVKDFQVYKPSCIFFFLIDRFHEMLKKNVKVDGNDWPVDMSTKMRNNDEGILKLCDELLKKYDQELLPCESFAEFVDLAGLHSDIPEPEMFISNLLISVANSASA